MSGAPQLDALERWMFEVVSDPDGVDVALERAGVAPSRYLLDHGELSHRERLEIYASMYRARLVEAIHDDFEAVRAAMGSGAFARVVERYVDATPSTHYSLDAYGRDFARYLASDAESALPRRDVLVDIARVEWAMVESFSAEDCELLESRHVSQIPPEAVEDLRLLPAPALSLLELRYPIAEWLDRCLAMNREVREVEDASDGESGRDQGAGNLSRGVLRSTLPEAEAAWIAVHRLDGRASYIELDQSAYALLRRLTRGEPLGRAMRGVVEDDGFDAEDLLPELGGWFADWAGRGFFRVEC